MTDNTEEKMCDHFEENLFLILMLVSVTAGAVVGIVCRNILLSFLIYVAMMILSIIGTGIVSNIRDRIKEKKAKKGEAR
jgi:hypothetical protein